MLGLLAVAVNEPSDLKSTGRIVYGHLNGAEANRDATWIGQDEIEVKKPVAPATLDQRLKRKHRDFHRGT